MTRGERGQAGSGGARPGGAADSTGWRYERADRSVRNVPWRRRWRHARRKALQPLVLTVAPSLVRALARTWRVEDLAPDRRRVLIDEGPSCIAVLWHGRMLAAMPEFASRDVRVLVSMAGDGDIALEFLRRFGYGTIRGSSSRRGVSALREMLASLDASTIVTITPDGPRGPRHSVSRGPAFLARATGFAIVPLAFGVDRAWYARSWDRFTIPKPRARIAFEFCEPIEVPRDTQDGELEAIGARIHDALQDAERRCFAHVGSPVDW